MYFKSNVLHLFYKIFWLRKIKNDNDVNYNTQTENPKKSKPNQFQKTINEKRQKRYEN